ILIPNCVVQQLGLGKTLERVPPMEKCYVTIDIDVLNTSQAPGTCSPEADGMSYSQVKGLLFGIAEKSNVVGFDVMCVNPYLDPTGRTPLFAAQLTIEFLGAIFG
ncbi:MAG: arginase family protein, partial [Thermodesulfobacteriota bacterium]